ncbi:DUF1515 family protein [Streptomyces sp. NPDC087437]|uniref:DUF1515 family protein n=1 Tax=Streptomyces sp. NPDC087437 TaxID=3365789 RepID=UPI003825C9A7
MTAAPDPTTNVAVELEKLRGEINTGLESIKGTLNILVERTTRTDADVARLRHDMESDDQAIRDELKTVKDTVEDLKKWRWLTVGAAGAVGVIASYAVQFIAH